MVCKKGISRSNFYKGMQFFLMISIGVACSSIPTKSKSFSQIDAAIPFPRYEKLSNTDKILADSILTVALDHEALYSLMGDLKPLSSIGRALSYDLGKDSVQFDGYRNVVDLKKKSTQKELEKIASLNRVLRALSFGNYQFLLIPFKHVWEGKRHLQILVCRKDLLGDLLQDKAAFFAQWGFVSKSNPAVVLTAIEFEQRNDRYRAYGYLFGYPEHAVEFFVNASIDYQKTDTFVKRSFFNIPVFAGVKGYFTYALPENVTPSVKDSLLFKKASKILNEYKAIKPKYVNGKGALKSVKLLRDWWGKTTKK